eukprot:CAMPEP_0119326780 /NCGR_PEP_ID=MMETSP1333-20130426/69278_1 /TAXON_ID=418940 /ORGANISM="Scyphosphaera apsteinii, Strain RCC1455" /LENGTH=424 /DNA_ID=CAMNT_0007335191 /DNA_START=93 /DNA_END=1364 /DNA_ORIENTATION=+
MASSLSKSWETSTESFPIRSFLHLADNPDYLLTADVHRMTVKMARRNETRSVHWVRFPDGTLRLAKDDSGSCECDTIGLTVDTSKDGAPLVLGFVQLTESRINRWFFDEQDMSLRLLAYPDEFAGVNFVKKIYDGAKVRYYSNSSHHDIAHPEARKWRFSKATLPPPQPTIASSSTDSSVPSSTKEQQMSSTTSSSSSDTSTSTVDTSASPAHTSMHVMVHLEFSPEYVLTPDTNLMVVRMARPSKSSVHWLRFPDGTLRVANGNQDAVLAIDTAKKNTSSSNKAMALPAVLVPAGADSINKWYYRVVDKSLRLMHFPGQALGLINGREVADGARVGCSSFSTFHDRPEARRWDLTPVKSASYSVHGLASSQPSIRKIEPASTVSFVVLFLSGLLAAIAVMVFAFAAFRVFIDFMGRDLSKKLW